MFGPPFVTCETIDDKPCHLPPTYLLLAGIQANGRRLRMRSVTWHFCSRWNLCLSLIIEW
jgi:hypothetical protein